MKLKANRSEDVKQITELMAAVRRVTSADTTGDAVEIGKRIEELVRNLGMDVKGLR